MSKFLNQPFVPTEAQQKLLLSLKKEEEHVFFRAETGSGKSFILAMHALNRPRSLDASAHPRTSILILVPNPDLAIQYYYWITQVLGTSVGDSDRAAKIVQAFFRTEETEEKAQEERLEKHPVPHIVISTPTRMLDMIASNPNAFDFSCLTNIILDEADDIVVPREQTSSKKIQHRAPGEILLDYLFEKHRTQPSTEFLRLIATSATLSTTFASFIEQKEWVSDPVVTFTLAAPSKVYYTPSNTEQHALMVSLVKSPTPELVPDRFRIKPAFLPYVTLHHKIRTNPPKNPEPPLQTDYPPNYLSISAIQHILRKTGINKAVALIPHGGSKADFVWACHYFGLSGARQLRFSFSEAEKGYLEPKPIDAGGPILYVSHPKDIRGVDLKNIGIVFVMGEFGSVEDYVHVIGRTGRLRQYGKVITLLEDTMENLEQRMTNVAVKMVRSGAKKTDSKLFETEKDLKALPGDEHEEIRREKGIITITDEVLQKQDRERRAIDDREKWLSMSQGKARGPAFESEEEEEVELERPASFGMSAPTWTPEETQEDEPKSSVERNSSPSSVPAVDWRVALAQALQEYPNPNPPTSAIDEPLQYEPISTKPTTSGAKLKKVHEDAVFLNPATSTPKATVQQVNPSPFPAKPSFPLQQYREAWKGVKEYYAKNKEGISPTDESKATEIAQASNLPNEAVHGRDDSPIVPSDISLSTENPDGVKNALQGESLRQAELSELIASKKRGRKPKAVIPKQEGVIKRPRGRPRKNNT